MSDVNCFGGSDGSIDLTVSGGSGSFTYLWSDGSTTEDLSGLSAGSYSVTVTDANFGCVETSSFTITAPSSSFAVDVQASGNGSACSGSGVTLSMLGWASPNYGYQWNDSNGAISGATSSTYVATVSGTYSLTVTNTSGCVSTSSGTSVNIVTVSVPSGLSTSNIQIDRATMNWSAVTGADHYDIRMRVQGTSGWPIALNYLYGTSKEKFNLTSSTVYEWQIRSVCSTDSSSVSSWSSTQSFTTATPCTVPLNGTTSGIGLTDATLSWDAVSGAWGYIIRYKKVNQGFGAFTFDTVNTNSLSLTGLSQGTSYHWQVKSMCDANGSNNSSFSSFVNFTTGSCNVTLSASLSDVNCFGGSDGSIDLTVSGGSGSFTYVWDKVSPNFVNDIAFTEDLSGLSAGIYSVTVTDANFGCVETSLFTITAPSSSFAVDVQASGNGSACSGSGVTLSMLGWASPNYGYQWNDSNGAISGATSSTYVATVSGTYSLTVTNTSGCVSTSSGTSVNIVTVSVPSGLSTSNIQ